MYFVVFSILNFLIKKLISEYSLEFGFVSWGSSLPFSVLVTAAPSARAASTPEEVRAEVCALPRLRRWTLCCCWTRFGPVVRFSQLQ